MKRLLKTLKYLFFGALGLVAVAAAGLLLYYQSIYKETPLPAATAVLYLK